MPLPFILAGAAIAAAGFGAKKGYDGYQDKSEANRIFEQSKKDYDSAKSYFDEVNEKTNKSLESLGDLQLNVGSDFNEFRRISDSLLKKINGSGNRELTINIPQHQLDKVENLAMSTTAYLGKVGAAGAAGVGAAYAVYGGVMALAAASTGTPIAALSGAAAYNATMAAIGGGSLAAGGFGMAGGAMVLGGVVAAPIIAIAGWAFASHAEEALEKAHETRREVSTAISKFDKARAQLSKTSMYVQLIHEETSRVYDLFHDYFVDLKTMDAFIRNNGDINMVASEIIQIIESGFKLAAILTDIITTPLFKVKTDANGVAIIGKDNIVEIETDSNGMQVLNVDGIKDTLDKSEQDTLAFDV